MRHYKKGRKLGTDSSHTKAMKKNLVVNLFANDRIKTTLERAKEIRGDVDRVITWAKRGDVHSRRLAIAKLGNKDLVAEIFSKVEQGMFADRPGGYSRIMRLGMRRGDSATIVIMELVREQVVKKSDKADGKAADKTAGKPAKKSGAKAAATEVEDKDQAAVEEADVAVDGADVVEDADAADVDKDSAADDAVDVELAEAEAAKVAEDTAADDTAETADDAVDAAEAEDDKGSDDGASGETEASIDQDKAEE